MSKEPNIKLEKITLWTSMDSYGQEGTALQVLTALDEILPVLEDAGIETKILSYDSEDLELTTKPKKRILTVD
tara:strand:+ start:286 stop:504 length:219 start_codon:yes stop_codon:yes gene_type:complete